MGQLTNSALLSPYGYKMSALRPATHVANTSDAKDWADHENHAS